MNFSHCWRLYGCLELLTSTLLGLWNIISNHTSLSFIHNILYFFPYILFDRARVGWCWNCFKLFSRNVLSILLHGFVLQFIVAAWSLVCKYYHLNWWYLDRGEIFWPRMEGLNVKSRWSTTIKALFLCFLPFCLACTDFVSWMNTS